MIMFGCFRLLKAFIAVGGFSEVFEIFAAEGRVQSIKYVIAGSLLLIITLLFRNQFFGNRTE